MRVDKILLLLLSSLSLKHHKRTLSWVAVNLWHNQSLRLLLDNNLLKPTSTTLSIQCQGCEKHCNINVIPFEYPNKTKYYAACDDPFMHGEMGRMTIPAEQLIQWEISIKQVAVVIARLLGLPDDISYKANQKNIDLGSLKSKTGRKSIVLNIEPLSLMINQNELPISDLLYFDLSKSEKLEFDIERVNYVLNLKQAKATKSYYENTSKQDQRKANTQAMYADWQEEAVKLSKQNPGKGNNWICAKIAKTALAKGKSAETIRRNINI